jgi:hypothetical protein
VTPGGPPRLRFLFHRHQEGMTMLHSVKTAVLVLALALVGLPAGGTPAWAQSDASQETSRTPLQQAFALYESAQFAAAADLLVQAIRNGTVAGDDMNAARELLARCLVKSGRRLEAKETWKSVLRSDMAYEPDAVKIPPDEMEVFRLAKSEFDSDMLELGRRRPASIGGLLGFGQGVHQDLADLASSSGGPLADDFQSNAQFGYSVRFPLRPRWSIDFELSRLRSETADALPATRNAHAEYTASAIPVVASLYYQANDHPRLHISGFGGVGILPSEATLEFEQTLVSGRLIPTQIIGKATGTYLHAGVEVEYHLAPRFAVSGRMLARRADSGELKWPRDNFEIYESFPESVLGNRSVDFSGLAANVGVRAYIGY